MINIGTIKDSVTTFNNLPLSGNTLGDVRMITDVGTQYIWNNPNAVGSLSSWHYLTGHIPSVISPREHSNIELELGFVLSNIDHYKELLYTGNKLTGIDIWSDSLKTHKLFEKQFTYVGNNLSTMTITRIYDLESVTKSFTYVGNKLASISVII